MIDVAVDARKTRRMSLGMRACVDAIVRYLPRHAPDLKLAFVGKGEHFSWDEEVDLPLTLASLRPKLAYYSSPLVPIVRTVPYALQVHDLTHVRFPELYSPAVRLYYATVGAAAIRGARAIVVADEGIGRDLGRYFGVPSDRIRVAPLGYDPAMLERPDAEPSERPYLLYAGNRRPHKNLTTLIAAWRSLPDDAGVDLYIAGPDADDGLRSETAGGRRLVVLGEVDRERLWRLYRGALAYVHPALAEGFGLPMLEALAAGTPVIGSTGSVPGLIKSYVWSFEALDSTALRDAIAAVVSDPEEAKRLAGEGAAAVRAYTWDRFALEVARVFRGLVEPPAAHG